MRSWPCREIAGSIRSFRHVRSLPSAARSIWFKRQLPRHSGTFRQTLFPKYLASVKDCFSFRREEVVDSIPDEFVMSASQSAQLRLVEQMLGLKTSALPDEFRDVVLVCVDCEAYEFAQNKITEIGVSVLDMRDITFDVSTVRSDDFISHMRYAHYRITEYGKLINRRWVKGHPENFIFGQSIWINRADARHVLDRIFRDPASLATAHHSLPDVAGAVARKIVIVGHDIANDTTYLKHLDFDLGVLTNVVGRIDTQRIASVKKHRIGLGRLLEALDVQAQFLHNAGNDAAYTMQALVLMSMLEYREPGSVLSKIGRQHPKSHSPLDDGQEPRPNRRERRRLERLHRQREAVEASEGGTRGDESRHEV